MYEHVRVSRRFIVPKMIHAPDSDCAVAALLRAITQAQDEHWLSAAADNEDGSTRSPVGDRARKSYGAEVWPRARDSSGKKVLA